MLAHILAIPRTAPASGGPAVRRPASVKRIAVGGLIAAAAVTATLAAPMPWSGHPNPADAFAVQRHRDGSVSVVVHWKQLAHPAELQGAVDKAGARVRVLTGPERPGRSPATSRTARNTERAPFGSQRGLEFGAVRDVAPFGTSRR